MLDFTQLVINGVMVGAIYGLVAVGFALIYKASGVFNFAQGELLMLGGFLSWSMMMQFNLGSWQGILVALLLAALFGLLLQRLIISPMVGQPLLSVVMVTIALAAVLRGFANLMWGEGGWKDYPKIFSTEPLMMGELILTEQKLYILLAVVALLIFFAYFFRATLPGLRMRAVANDNIVAQSTGISVKNVMAVAWVIASVTAAIGGVFLGSINGIDVNVLSGIGLKAIPAALLGGLDSIIGAVLGGLIIGVIESLTLGYIGYGLQEVVAYIIMLLVLIFRPYGLLGLKRIERI